MKTSNYLFNRSLIDCSPVQEVEGEDKSRELRRVGVIEPSASTATDTNTSFVNTFFYHKTDQYRNMRIKNL